MGCGYQPLKYILSLAGLREGENILLRVMYMQYETHSETFLKLLKDGVISSIGNTKTHWLLCNDLIRDMNVILPTNNLCKQKQ